MALVQAVKDGKLVDTSAESTSESAKKTTAEKSNGLDKDAFLQLLIAQMKYQDPLSPADNTEYVSQLATFSQLEETQNMQNTLMQMQANDLVGKQVILKVTSAITGETSFVSGMVDYVVHEKGDTYLSVNNKMYSIDDLDTVGDTDYMNAVELAKSFKSAIAALPSKYQLTLSDEVKLKNIRTILDSLSSYQKGFLDEEDLKKFEELEAQMEIIKSLSGSKEPEDGEDGDNADGSEKTPDVSNPEDASGGEAQG